MTDTKEKKEVMPDIDTELAAFEAMRNDLEAHEMGKWVLESSHR